MECIQPLLLLVYTQNLFLHSFPLINDIIGLLLNNLDILLELVQLMFGIPINKIYFHVVSIGWVVIQKGDIGLEFIDILADIEENDVIHLLLCGHIELLTAVE